MMRNENDVVVTGRPRSPAALRVVLSMAALALVTPVVASADSPPDAGRGWEPPKLRDPLYDYGNPVCHPPFNFRTCEGAPVVMPDHELTVQTSDGESIHVGVWLPHREGDDGPDPPARVPVVAKISPYSERGRLKGNRDNGPIYSDVLVRRGYAYAQVHMRGTGASTGCFDIHSAQDADDAARVVEALADAPWSSGRVGLTGVSHEASAALNVAGRGDPARLNGLAAIVPVSPLTSTADLRTRDGVVMAALRAGELWSVLHSLYATTFRPGLFDALAGRVSPVELADRSRCHIEDGRQSLDLGGAPTDWELERELRRSAADIDVPTLFTMGLQEIQMRNIPGFFDQIGRRARGPVRKVGMFGQWGHARPDEASRVPGWQRADWDAAYVAWFDRWLMGMENGVEEWPTVQVQDTTGQWRTERDYPLTGGPVGQLALGADGVLGDPSPNASDELPAGAAMTPRAQGASPSGDTGLVWRTVELKTPLRLTGVPVLDLWIEIAPSPLGIRQPAGQIVAELVAVGRDGKRIPLTRRVGARSLRYLDPIVDNHFAQREPKAPPVGVPLRVQIRFDPADLVAPAEGRLELRLATVGPAANGEVLREEDVVYPDRYMTVPDIDGGSVTILHDCEHPSALRFLMPRAVPDLIDVRENDELEDPLGDGGAVTEEIDDPPGGLAAQKVCGKPPQRLDSFRRARP